MQIEYLKLRKFLMKFPRVFSVIHNFQEVKRSRREKNKRKRLQIYGYELAEKLYHTFKNSEYEYFYTYGTLLGLVRDGKFIPYDNDLDLGMIKTETFEWESFQKFMEKNGFKKIREFSWDGKVTEQAYSYKKLTFDIFLYEYVKEKNKMITYSYFNNRKNEYTSVHDVSVEGYYNTPINDFRYIESHGVKFRIPEEPEILLREVYEETWKIPIENWDYKQSKARFELEGVVGRKVLL